MVGRATELAELAAAWTRAEGGEPALAVVWGRRRVGKTFLLTRFARGKRAVYFTATRQDADERQLRRVAANPREARRRQGADLPPPTLPGRGTGPPVAPR